MPRKQAAAGPTYTATDDTGKVWYRSRPHGNLWGELPIGARAVGFSGKEDQWDGATFALESGRIITVRRDT